MRVYFDLLVDKESLDFQYFMEEGEFLAMWVPFHSDFIEEGSALCDHEQVVVKHLLNGQITEVLLAQLHPLLVVRPTLNAFGNAEDGNFVLRPVAILLEIGEVLC